MKDFVFVSGNQNKVALLEEFLGRKVDHHDIDIEELQSFDPLKVATHKAREAYKILKSPVLVDDVSLEYNAMKGMPGTFVKFFLHTIGPEGLAKILNAYDDRTANARVVLAFYDGKTLQIFEGVTEGTISDTPRGNLSTPAGHGWNSIFVPNGQDKTFAEMTTEHVDYSPRNKAVQKLKKYLEEA